MIFIICRNCHWSWWQWVSMSIGVVTHFKVLDNKYRDPLPHIIVIISTNDLCSCWKFVQKIVFRWGTLEIYLCKLRFLEIFNCRHSTLCDYWSACFTFFRLPRPSSEFLLQLIFHGTYDVFSWLELWIKQRLPGRIIEIGRQWILNIETDGECLSL